MQRTKKLRELETEITETVLTDVQEAELTEQEQQDLKNQLINQPSYPESIFTQEQIKNGASVLYLIGK